MFKPVPAQVDFVKQEHEILKFWEEINAFNQLRALRAGGPRWSFIDGPITANNPMGVHHGWGRTYKDLFQRFKAMQGFDQRWQNGFDCQGLWIEVEVERELGFTSKKDIEAYGLADFVLRCKERVLNYAAVQTEQSMRLGYWMDWNDPDFLRVLRDRLREDPNQVLTVQGLRGSLTGTVEQVVGWLGPPRMGGSYFTFSDENNYAIWTMLKSCHARGWVYKGRDVMPWCARCGTGISQHEIVTEGYRELTHPSITLRFPLRGRDRESLLVWTTTPWTLTSNVAAAVGPDLSYVRVRQGDEVFYLSKGTLHMLQGDYEVLGELSGAEMEGWAYDGPFDDLPAQQESRVLSPSKGGSVAGHRVILWREVGEEEGTGIVHIAPGCGAEDFALSREFDLPVIAPLDEAGVYGAGFGWLTGMQVNDVARPIFEDLNRKGLTYHIADYTHRYPVCWRCEEELIFRLVDEWFINMGEQLEKPYEEVTEEEKEKNLRYQIMEVVINETQWYPAFGLERELDWLRNMHDWMISKKRYSGLALPIWECQECGHFEVIGSKEELEERAVAGWDEFEGHTPHRPYVDAVKIACPNCQAKVSRIPDVGNPWLDAGIVGLSTLHYKADREYWSRWFPADLISESFPGQFRNWFYSLLAMSTVMERRAPFKHCFTYGTLLAEDGRAMHKSWGNAIEFNEAADRMGVDVMRWLYCDHKPEKDLLFGYHRADEVRRQFLIPLWNVYSFFVTYANIDGWTPTGRVNWEIGKLVDERASHQSTNLPPYQSTNLLDRWILARLDEVVQTVTEKLEGYEPNLATAAVDEFIDDLSNWYVRRSRRRFWAKAGASVTSDADKRAAYGTLYHVLVTLSRLLAPFTPFVTEVMYQNLVRTVDPDAPESVHHGDWPTADAERLAASQGLLDQMALARQVVTLGHAARAQANVKVRQPLGQVVVFAPGRADDLAAMRDLVVDELNVKELEVAREAGELVSFRLLPVNKVLGPRFGKLFPRVRAALSAVADPAAAAAALEAGQSLTLDVDGRTVALAPDEVLVQTEARVGMAVLSEGGVTVALDTTLTPDLVAEGLAREVVRRVQTLRKEADFQLDDRIVTTYETDDELGAVVAAWAEYIRAETLSDALVAGPPQAGAQSESYEVEGHPLTLGVALTQK
jgi:isoleucyl-tRNA synthetase